jgi:putative methyltransferase (TIGR04325 family)
MPPIVPRLPIISAVFNGLRGAGFHGNYRSFAEAAARCRAGYEADNIVEHALKVALEFRARHEGPSLFDSRFYRSGFALLQARIALEPGLPLHVLDFGGGLGEHHFSLRKWLGEPLTWTVLETAPMAQAGNRHLANEHLRFASELNSVRDRSYQVVLASGVLQCLPEPHRKFDELSALGATYFILDRLPLIDAGSDRLTIQKVPSHIFKASFPAWFLSEKAWRKTMADAGWSVLLEWNVPEDAPYLDRKPCPYKGFALKRC